MPKNKSLHFYAGLISGIILFNIYLTLRVEQKVISPIVREQTIQKPVEVRYEERPVYVGFASYYSHDGCVGCDPNQIMANGQKFDENAMTIAFNQLPLGTTVEVVNLDTGDRVVAEVTDTGGFNKLGRIADLSKGVAEKIGLKTDRTIISIKEITNAR